MKPTQPPMPRSRKAKMPTLASFTALVVSFAIFLAFAALPSGANTESDAETPERTGLRGTLSGMNAEVGGGEESISVEVPEGCRLATHDGDGFSLVVENSDGTRTTVSSNTKTRVFMKDGHLAIVGRDAPENVRGEVVEDEGFTCLDEADEADGGGEVLSRTATTSDESGESDESEDADESERATEQAEESEAPEVSEESGDAGNTSAGQQIAPLAATATINPSGDEDDEDGIEDIEIATSACPAGEAVEVEDGASITLSNGDGETFVFTDGNPNVDITSEGSTVTIAPTDEDGTFVPEPDGDGELGEGTATVEAQTGISCGAADDDSDDDSNDDGAGDAGNTTCATGESLTDIAAFSENSEGGEATRRTDSFTTTGSFFRVSYRATSTGTDNDDAGFRASILGESGRATDEFAADFGDGGGSDTGAVFAELPAGTYSFRVVAENVQYDITVAECRTGSPTTSVPETSDPSRDVIPDTVPDKALANTGGPSLTLIGAGVMFVFVGAAAAWLLARRQGA